MKGEKMDKLREYGEILDLCEIGEDYSEKWFYLFGQTVSDGKKPLTLSNVINNSETLGFNLIVAYFKDSCEELKIKDFVEKYSIDIEREFFDFVKDIVKNEGVVRFEEPLRNDNFRVGKQTTMAYVPN